LPMLIALLPYQIWVIIASFLSWSYARLNWLIFQFPNLVGI
jgi:tryptophan-rich sensory protein